MSVPERPENLFEDLTKRNVSFAVLVGELKLKMARQPSDWMKQMLWCPQRVKLRPLLSGVKQECEDRGMQPWEFLNQHCLRIGILGRDRSKNDLTTPIDTVDPLASHTNEMSVVMFWHSQFARPIHKALENINNSTTANDIFPLALKCKLASRPEKNVAMIFDDDDELEHWNQMVAKINEKMKASGSKRREVGHPLTWTGRPDDQIGFTGLSTAKPPPIMKRERADDSDDEDSDKEEETASNFIPGTNVEHKAMGRLTEKGFRKGFDKSKLISTAEPRRKARYKLRMSTEVQNRYRADVITKAGFPESVSRVVTQIGAYGILTDSTHGIAHDANLVVLCVFDGLKKGNDWQRMDRLYLGETVSMGIINIRKSPRDIVLNTVLGFVMEGIVESLEKLGQDCSRDRLMDLTTKFMDDNPRLMKILCTDIVKTGTLDTEAMEMETMQD